MNQPPGPWNDSALRMRAAIRVARRKQFAVSATILGLLMVFNLWLYSQNRSPVPLVLDAVFAVILIMRAYQAFGPVRADEAKIQAQMNRMRQQQQPPGPGGFVVQPPPPPPGTPPQTPRQTPPQAPPSPPSPGPNGAPS